MLDDVSRSRVCVDGVSLVHSQLYPSSGPFKQWILHSQSQSILPRLVKLHVHQLKVKIQDLLLGLQTQLLQGHGDTRLPSFASHDARECGAEAI